MITVVALAVAAACGGDDSDASDDPSATVATTVSTTVSTAAPATTVAPATSTTTEVSSTTAVTTTEVATTTTEPPVERVCAAVAGAIIGRSGSVPGDNDALVVDIVERELGALGASVLSRNAEFSPDQQLADIDALVAEGVDVLVVDPVPATTVLDRLAELAAGGLAVIVEGTDLGGPDTISVLFDIESATASGVDRLADAVGQGPVAAVFGPAAVQVYAVQAEVFASSAERLGLAVATTAVDESFVGASSEAIIAGWQAEGVLADLQGVWTHAPASASGLAAGSQIPAIVTIDMTAELVDLVAEGRVVAAFDVPIDLLGRSLGHAAVEVLCDRPLPAEVFIDLLEVDAATVSAWLPAAERASAPGEVELVVDGDRARYVAR